MTSSLTKLFEIGRKPVKEMLFTCGGNVSMDNTITLYYHDDNNGAATTGQLSFPPSSDKDIEQLVAICKSATFGHGGQEVLDASYRNAVMLDAQHFASSFHLEATSILEDIRSVLMPNATSIRAKPYKLNIYGKDGFFKTHRDTPRGNQMFGTLVVCLPSAFTGGDFVVTHNGIKQTYVWSQAPSNEAMERGVQWCAFYSDCEHEILPVTSGYRVTMTYLLELPSPMNTGLPASSLHLHMELVEQLLNAMKDPTFAKHGKKLGFALEHSYTIDSEGTIPELKGLDRVLKETLDHVGLKYKFIPVYESDEYNVKALLKEQDEGTDIGYEGLYTSQWKHYMTTLDYAPDDVEYGLDVEGLKLKSASDVVWIIPPTHFPFVKYGPTYGNEPSMGSYYAAACFLVKIPAYEDRIK